MLIISCVTFVFNATAATEIYTLSLHDALPIWFLLPRVARLMIHTPTAISIFVCLSMVQLMAHKNTDSSRRVNQDRKSGSAGMPRPISYAVFCLKKKTKKKLKPLNCQTRNKEDSVIV